MPTLEMLDQARTWAEQAALQAEEYSGLLGSARQFILDNFGQPGLIATYISLAVLALFVISRLAKLTFSAVKYLVIPSVALAFLASVFLPYPFATALPVSVTACSLVLLFKG